MVNNEESTVRIHRLFMRKLAVEQPDHPWVLKEQSGHWQEPRPVDRWFWVDLPQYQNGVLVRYGRVSWGKAGGLYSPSITIQNAHGLGLYCWPSFRAPSDAQEFVERLMGMDVDALQAIHGTEWPGVVL